MLEKRRITDASNYVKKSIPKAVVLDAACGTGRITEVLPGRIFDGTGGGITPAMINTANRGCHSISADFSMIALDSNQPDLRNE